jgi:hypothetical protein
MRRLIATVVCLFLLGGCSGLQTNVKMKRFARTAEGYSKAIRWSEYDVAAQFVKRSNQEEMMEDLTRLEDVRVTDYTVKNITTQKEDTEIAQVVEIQYYRTGEMIHKKKLIMEQWAYDQKEGQWYLTSRLPNLP